MTKTLTSLQKRHRFQIVENLDEPTWNEIEAIIKQKKIEAYEAKLKPMTEQELKQAFEKSVNDFEKGQFHTLEAVEEISKNW